VKKKVENLVGLASVDVLIALRLLSGCSTAAVEEATGCASGRDHPSGATKGFWVFSVRLQKMILAAKDVAKRHEGGGEALSLADPSSSPGGGL
jgi:hypothetical protein